MSYTAPSVGPAGLTIPSYNDILQFFLDNFRAIYGQDVYLGNDSADFQIISIFALAAADAEDGLQLDYNNKAPNFAVGAALDSLVKLNGLARKLATFSTVPAVITGTPGAIITNGVVADTVFNNRWDLPTPLTIPGGGTITISVICEVPGAFTVPIGALTRIVTPTAGWTSVNNIAAGTPGQPVEPDSALRARQAISTELPSITLLAGTVAGIAATPGVTRYNIAENPTSAVDALGNPPHSISAVVEGGVDLDVATTIYNNRGIGCFTNPNPGGSPTSGSITVPVTDPFTGIVTNIGFARPTDVPIFVTVNAHLLTGGTSATITAMHDTIVSYLNSLQIGELISFGALYAAAMSVNPDIARPIVTIVDLKSAKTVTPTGVVDLTVQFWEVADGVSGNVLVNSV